ncbi:MAG: hypothetical protein IPL21_16160 [Saprospirales bacterium]|nr:hypothetical protein [Saprospirales bacterium]
MNTGTTICLLLGFLFIKQKNKNTHRFLCCCTYFILYFSNIIYYLSHLKSRTFYVM